MLKSKVNVKTANDDVVSDIAIGYTPSRGGSTLYTSGTPLVPYASDNGGYYEVDGNSVTVQGSAYGTSLYKSGDGLVKLTSPVYTAGAEQTLSVSVAYTPQGSSYGTLYSRSYNQLAQQYVYSAVTNAYRPGTPTTKTNTKTYTPILGRIPGTVYRSLAASGEVPSVYLTGGKVGGLYNAGTMTVLPAIGSKISNAIWKKAVTADEQANATAHLYGTKVTLKPVKLTVDASVI